MYIICWCSCAVPDRFGKIEGVKILPQRYPNIGVAAFIDFYSVQSAIEAKEAKHKIGGCDIRTNFKSKPTEKFDATQRKWQENLSTEKPEKRDKSRGHERYNEREGMHSSTKRFASLCAQICLPQVVCSIWNLPPIASVCLLKRYSTASILQEWDSLVCELCDSYLVATTKLIASSE